MYIVQEEPFQACVFGWGDDATYHRLAICLKTCKPLGPVAVPGPKDQEGTGSLPQVGSPWRCRRPLRPWTRSPFLRDPGEPWVKRPSPGMPPASVAPRIASRGLDSPSPGTWSLGLPLSHKPGLTHTWTSSGWG